MDKRLHKSKFQVLIPRSKRASLNTSVQQQCDDTLRCFSLNSPQLILLYNRGYDSKAWISSITNGSYMLVDSWSLTTGIQKTAEYPIYAKINKAYVFFIPAISLSSSNLHVLLIVSWVAMGLAESLSYYHTISHCYTIWNTDWIIFLVPTTSEHFLVCLLSTTHKTIWYWNGKAESLVKTV